MKSAPSMLIVVLVIAVALVSGSHAQQPASHDATPLHYRIVASARPDSGHVSGRAELEVAHAALWSPTEVRLDRFSAGRDAAGRPRLTIAAVTADRAIRTVEDSAVTRVLLERALGPGEAVTLRVEFTVPFNPEFRELLGYQTFWSHQPGHYWYPDVVVAGGERARFKDFEVTLEHPPNYGVVTSGARVGEAEAIGSLVRATYRADHVEGFSIHFGEGYETIRLAGDGYTIVGLLPPDDPEPFRRVVRLASQTVDWYREAYGFFPVRQIGVVPGPTQWGGGFPLPNVFLIHRGNLSEDFLRWITAHELGHYYWGLYVLSATDERLDWLNLANGIWIDHLYLAESEDVPLEEVWRRSGAGDPYPDFFQAQLENREARLGLTGGAEEALDFDYNSWIRHSKAAIGVYLQARRLGSDGFLRLQREIIRDYRFQPLPLGDFTARLEAAGALGAADFFERWSEGDARIEFDVSRVESERVEEDWLHRVTVLRLGTVAADVDVELIGTDGGRSRHTLGADAFAEREARLEVTMAAPLADVRLDPDGALPIWNSSHPGVLRAWLQAMWRADLTQPFIDLAHVHVARNPADDDVLYLLGSELFTLGRHREVVETLEGRVRGEGAAPCEVRPRCQAAIILARSLQRLGREAEASALLEAIRERAAALRLGRPWEQARAEGGASQ